MRLFIFLLSLMFLVSCGGGFGSGSKKEGKYDLFVNFTSAKMLVSLTADTKGYLKDGDGTVQIGTQGCRVVKEIVADTVFLYNNINAITGADTFLAKSDVKGANYHILKENADGTYYVDRSTIKVTISVDDEGNPLIDGDGDEVAECPSQEDIAKDYEAYAEQLAADKQAAAAEEAEAAAEAETETE